MALAAGMLARRWNTASRWCRSGEIQDKMLKIAQ
jgi:hypothetical protein